MFSSKLHEYLKPRSHILVEPLHDYHQPFLRTLVDGSDSKYHLRDWQFRDAVELDTYIKEGLLLGTEQGKLDAVKANGRNDSILVLANMARGKASRDDTPGQLNSHYRVLSFINALRNGAGLQSRGPVRMLLWLADREKNALLPQTVTTRKKIGLQLETYYHVEEIVGGGSRGKQHRERTLDMESGRRVAKRMEAAGIQIPIHRKDEMQIEVEKTMSVPMNGDSRASSPLARDWEKELHQLLKAFDRGEFPQFEGGPPGPHEVRMKNHDTRTLTSQFRRLRELRRHAGRGDRQQTVLEGLLQAEAKMDSLEIEILHKTLDRAERDEKVMERNRIRGDLKAILAKKEPSFVAKFAFLGDDRRALALDPPLLMWDRREAEPLVAQEDEFHSSHKLALLDFRPLVPLPWPMTDEQTVYFDYLSTHLFYHGSQTVKNLAQLAPGAFEALAPQVPEFHDPLKGGRHDLEDLRARSLTPDIVYRLALAWQKWAFKPPTSDLVDRSTFGDPFYDHPESSHLGAIYIPKRG